MTRYRKACRLQAWSLLGAGAKGAPGTVNGDVGCPALAQPMMKWLALQVRADNEAYRFPSQTRKKISEVSLSTPVDLRGALRHVRNQPGERTRRQHQGACPMSSAAAINLSVSSVIPASPDALYAMVSDVTRMPEYSPETVKVNWVGAADGPAVGATFKGVNKLGFLSWSTKPTVTAAEPGRLFAFKVPGAAGPTWSYTFEPVDGGTLVTESVEQAKVSPAFIRFLQRRAGVTDRAACLHDGMTVTLERLAAAATAA
jgi:hypothetical protein